MGRSIEYYFSLQSPWAYLGHAPFQEVARHHGCTITYKPVKLVDLFAETGGLPLGKRHPVRQRYRLMELQRWRDKRGLAFHLQPRHWPFDATLADQCVIAILDQGHDPDPFLRRAFAAVWEGEYDLADAGVLQGLADDVGLSGVAVVEAARSEKSTAAYLAHHAQAIAASVFGSPSYVLDGEIFWGQDRVELLADALQSQREAYGAEV